MSKKTGYEMSVSIEVVVTLNKNKLRENHISWFGHAHERHLDEQCRRIEQLLQHPCIHAEQLLRFKGF
jgi:hypothetical protein